MTKLFMSNTAITFSSIFKSFLKIKTLGLQVYGFSAKTINVHQTVVLQTGQNSLSVIENIKSRFFILVSEQYQTKCLIVKEMNKYPQVPPPYPHQQAMNSNEPPPQQTSKSKYLNSD